MKHKLSIIIPTYNRENILCNTLTSVLYELSKPKTTKSEYEIIVVDQSIDHLPHVSRKLNELAESGKIILIKEKIASLPNARNIGVHLSTGDIVLFLDDDVLLQEDFINNLVRCYENPAISSVVGRVKLVNESGDNLLLNNQSPIKNIFRKILKNTIGGGKSFAISKLGFILSDTDNETSGYVDAGRGCCMSFRKSVFDRIGYFDINYRGNALREETDFFCRIKEAGLKVYFDSTVFLHHVMANTGGCRNEVNESYWQTYFFNQCYFYIKNFGFPLWRIKLILFFDYYKCKKAQINIHDIMKNQYLSAKSIS